MRAPVDHGPVISHFAEFVEFLAGPDHDPVSAINGVKDPISLFVSMAAQAQQQAAKRVASRRDTPGVKKGSHIKKVFDHRGRQWSNYDLSIPPKNGPEAYDRADFESRWKKSMLREMDNLTEHKTYGPWRPKKPGEHIIGFTWGEFKTKVIDAVARTATSPAIEAGEIDKARLCALGNQQIANVEYDRCSAPTIKQETLNCLLVKAAAIPEATLTKEDVKSAYLAGKVKHKITTGMVP